MATGDRICPNCGQWQVWCRCGWAAARQREQWNDTAAPYTFDWVTPPTITAPNRSGMYCTTTTVTTSNPRKRRHFRQVVY